MKANVIIFILVAFFTFVFPQSQEKLAILPFAVIGELPAEHGTALAEFLTSKIKTEYTLVERLQITPILHERLLNESDLMEDLKQELHTLEVDQILLGSLSYADHQYQVSFRIVSISSGIISPYKDCIRASNLQELQTKLLQSIHHLFHQKKDDGWNQWIIVIMFSCGMSVAVGFKFYWVKIHIHKTDSSTIKSSSVCPKYSQQIQELEQRLRTSERVLELMQKEMAKYPTSPIHKQVELEEKQKSINELKEEIRKLCE